MKKISLNNAVIIGFWLMAKNFNETRNIVLKYLENPDPNIDPLFFVLKDVAPDLNQFKYEIFNEMEISEIDKKISEINADANSDMDDDEFDNKWNVNSIYK